MGDVQPVKTPSTAPRETLAVHLHRCPFCHEDVAPEGATVCEGCLARHHVACWEEGGHCSSCSGDKPLRAPRPPLTEQVIRDLLTTNGYVEDEQDRFFADRTGTQEHARKMVHRTFGILLVWLMLSVALGFWWVSAMT